MGQRENSQLQLRVLDRKRAPKLHQKKIFATLVEL